MNESELRERLVMFGESLFWRGYACGTSGNISVKTDDGLLITPTNSSLGRLEASRLSKMTFDGSLISGDPPSKEVVLHLAVYSQRPTAGAVVHLHSTALVCVSCLQGLDESDCLPPLTPYYVMKIGKLPLIAYHPPGDPQLAEAVAVKARDHHAMLLANHGGVVAGGTLESAVAAFEELEETAKVFLALRDSQVRHLTPEQIDLLRKRFPV
jgi:ribulose-5-phosphate 4-epimerase/fuculose-1-phosphate aldolase